MIATWGPSKSLKTHPEIIRRATLGVGVYSAEPLVANRRLAVRVFEGGWAHRATIEVSNIVRVWHDVLTCPGVPPAAGVLHAFEALIVKLFCAARDLLPSNTVALVAADVAAIVEP